MIKTVQGDLLKSRATYICHQCNCVTDSGKGLSKLIFKKWPQSDIYKKRTERSKPGTIDVRHIGNNQYIVNMFAQIYPGPCKSNYDTSWLRLHYFKSCLFHMKDLEGSFAFPYKIGCGLARGNWDDYYKLIEEFAADKDVIIYKLKD